MQGSLASFRRDDRDVAPIDRAPRAQQGRSMCGTALRTDYEKAGWHLRPGQGRRCERRGSPCARATN